MVDLFCLGDFEILLFMIVFQQHSGQLFDIRSMHCPFATVKAFRFILLNSILLLPIMFFRFQFLQNYIIGVLFYYIGCLVFACK